MSIDQLEYSRQLIVAGVYDEPDLQSIVSTLFPKLSAGLRDRFQSLINMRIEKRILQNSTSFLKTIEKYNYVDLAAIDVTVPQGLSVDYLTLTSALEMGVNHVRELHDKTLNPYKRLLSNLINERTVRYTSGSIDPELEKRGKALQTVQDNLMSCYAGGEDSYIPYERAIKRNADWRAVFTNITALQSVGGINTKKIEKEIQDVMMLLDEVITMAKEKRFENAHPDLVKHLANITSVVAEEVTFVTTVIYNTQAAFTAVNETTRKLIDDLN